MPTSLYKPGEKDLTKLSRSNKTAPSEHQLRRGFAFLPGHAAERQTNGGQPVHAGLRQGCINMCILYGRQHGVRRPAPAASPRAFRQKKNAPGSLLKRFVQVGDYLFSRAVSSELSSAQVSLTSVFGMGTGGTSPSSTPTDLTESV